MAEQADFWVRNVLKEDDVGGDINVIRKLPDGTIDLDTSIAKGGEEQIPIQGPEVSMIINPPLGITDTKDCYVLVNSDIDLEVSCSRTDSNWTINIVPNDLPPCSPTTVNVDVGEGRPG
jgi:hypothetical protein